MSFHFLGLEVERESVKGSLDEVVDAGPGVVLDAADELQVGLLAELLQRLYLLLVEGPGQAGLARLVERRLARRVVPGHPVLHYVRLGCGDRSMVQRKYLRKENMYFSLLCLKFSELLTNSKS